MKEFRTLELSKEYYRLTRDIKLPAHLKDQFLRSSSSVALNLAEGNAKISEKEKFRFYEIAHGSFRESVTILDLENCQDNKIREIADRLGANLYKLTRSFRIKFDEPKRGRN
jgi:four helix bundle protein